jgi:2-deoxy-D-gluconate 3-dehydrogenase
MNVDLSGKTAYVTGGRRGIGRAFVSALRQAGARVAVIAKSEDRGDLPKDVLYWDADLSIPRQRFVLLYEISGYIGNPDILINNAGVSHSYAALDYPADEWQRILEVNLTAVFDLSCQAVRLGCKRIINISSISSFRGARNIVGYAAAKAAVEQMSKCLSNEWAPLGITVNCVAPGFIETDMLQLKEPENIIGRIPAGRLGTPRDVVGAMLFLASDEASYITGATIIVDGGWLGR